jgi:hypothetical protein
VVGGENARAAAEGREEYRAVECAIACCAAAFSARAVAAMQGRAR